MCLYRPPGALALVPPLISVAVPVVSFEASYSIRTVVLPLFEDVLHGLEQGEAKGAPARLAEDLPLFAAMIERGRPKSAPQQTSAVDTALADVDPDTLSPRDALQLIYLLKALLDEAAISPDAARV